MTDQFLPYSRQHITEADVEAVVEALTSPIISQGSRLENFESAFANAVQAKYAVGVSSGTAALHAMCVAANIGPGDEVIVPAMTFAGTANAVLYTGARPVFVDIDPVTVCIDPDRVETAVSGATRAIVGVDFGGHPADYPSLRAVAQKNDLVILADAAHSPGATIEGTPASSFADIAAFSFNPVKNLTSAEGGMVVTQGEDLAGAVRQFRTHGMTRAPERLTERPHGDWYYEQQFLGYNYKLSELHAALGLSQLARLDTHTQARSRLAALYHDALADLPLALPQTRVGAASSWHLYVIRTEPSIRRSLFDFLRARNIGVQVHYLPVPMHPYFRQLGYRMENLDNTRDYYESAISLPLHQAMTDQDLNRVVVTLQSYFR